MAVKNSPERLKSLADAESARFITERENYLESFKNETQKKIADLRANRARMLEEFKESAPEIKEVDTQIASLEESINKVAEKNDLDVGAFRNQDCKHVIYKIFRPSSYGLKTRKTRFGLF